MRRTLSGPAALVSSGVERGRSELEELVDLAVERALTRLSIPTRRDLDTLNARLDELEAKLARTTGHGAAQPGSRSRTGTRASDQVVRGPAETPGPPTAGPVCFTRGQPPRP